MDIKLNFINRSDDQNNSEVVIFQKNLAPGAGELGFINKSADKNNSDVLIFQKSPEPTGGEPAVAWMVIQNCGRGDNHPFVYPLAWEVGAGDSYGNFTPLLPAQMGQLFTMVKEPSGHELVAAGRSAGPNTIQIQNNLFDSAISASVYKNGKCLATKTGLAPGQKASFAFNPTIWIGVVSQVEEGQILNTAIMTSPTMTSFSLLGLASADIVMTGGGPGPKATSFQFTLQNVVMA